MSLKAKGQIFTTDMVLSLSVFFLIALISVSTLNMVWENQNRFNRADYMEQKAFQISDLMVRSSGYPEGWNETNVRIVGLSKPSHMIQYSLVSRFENVSESKLQEIWNLEEDTNYFINITAGNFTWTKGNYWSGNANYIVPKTRPVILNKSGSFKRGKLKFVLWE